MTRRRWKEIFQLNQVDQFGGREGEKGGEEKRKKRKERRIKDSEKLHLLSKIYGDRTVGFRWSKMQSSSTRRELRVGTRIWGFRQTPRGRGFSPTLVIFCLRVI